MKWLINLFKGKEDEIHTGPSDLHIRIAEIQARIAAVRSRNGWDNNSYQNTTTSKQLSQASRPNTLMSDIDNKELDALKAKLLGKKQ